MIRAFHSRGRYFLGVLIPAALGVVWLAQPCVSLLFGAIPNNNAFRLHMSSETVPITPDTYVEETVDTLITIPRAYAHDIPEGSYPSALHSIHVQHFLTPDEAATCLALANDYASSTGRFEEPDTTRHQTYSTCDFAVEDCESLEQYLENIDFHKRIYQRLSDAYGVDPRDMDYIDCFCANYRAHSEGNAKTMDRLEAHRDGSLLSYTVLLTPPHNFEGGGTFFDALRDVSHDSEEGSPLYPNGVVKPSRAGDCVLHSGKLLHGADVVTAGERTVLVGFVNVAEWCQRPGVIAEACVDFGRMDAAVYRQKRQEKMTSNGRKPGWKLRNQRFLPKGSKSSGKSHLSGFVPAFDSVTSRADAEYQRQKKLEAEDILLRRVLLPEGEKPVFEAFGEDITIL